MASGSLPTGAARSAPFWVMPTARGSRFRQEFVSPSDRLRLGAFECRVDDLLRQLPGGRGGRADGSSSGQGAEGVPAFDDRIAGPVLRDPETGEIVPEEER